jgi:hypothetical protein
MRTLNDLTGAAGTAGRFVTEAAVSRPAPPPPPEPIGQALKARIKITALKRTALSQKIFFILELFQNFSFGTGSLAS